MADTTLKLILLGEDRSAGSSLDKVGKVAGLAFAAAGAAAIAFGKDSLDAFAEADAEQKKLEDAYRRFPGLADGNIDSLRELNEAIQRKVGADADDIAGAQAVLAQYELNEDQLRQMTPLLVDYATKTGQDMPGAAKNLGKALMGNTRAMKDLGIDFKVTGDRGADFAAIVGHLEEKVGGYAESIPEAERNQKILAASFGDLQESLGEKLQPIMIEAMRGLQNLTDAAQDADSVFAPLTDITLGLATAIADLTGALGEGGDLEWLSKLKEFADYASGITGLTDAARWYTQRSKEAGAATEGTADAMRDLRGGARDAAGSVGDLTDETDEGTDAAQEYADAQKAAADALTEVYRNQLALRGDTRALEAAYDDAARAIKENGETLDVNTAKGRANQDALDRIASAALSVEEGMRKSGASTAKIDGQMGKARDQFIKTAIQMGASSKEAVKLADKLGLVRSKNVDVTTSADPKEVVELRDQLAKIQDKKVVAEAKGDTREVKRLKDEIASVKGKVVEITAKVKWSGSLSKKISVDGTGAGKITLKAGGGPITGGIRGIDSVPILAMPDEHMLTVQDVENFGGHEGVFALREAAARGTLPARPGRRFAGAGATSIVGSSGGSIIYRTEVHYDIDMSGLIDTADGARRISRLLADHKADMGRPLAFEEVR